MKKFLNFVFCTIFIAYFLILLDTVFFFRTGDSMRSVNLIPFKSITQYVNVYDGVRHKLVDMNIWGNVLMFIPFGINDIFKRKVFNKRSFNNCTCQFNYRDSSIYICTWK